MYLYAVQKTDRPEQIKVGYAKDVDKRRNYLENKTGERLEIIHHRFALHPRYAEKYVHQQFSGARMLGEWFNLGKSASERSLLLSTMDYAVALVDPHPKKLGGGSATEDAIREAIRARMIEKSVSISDISEEIKVSESKIRLITSRDAARIPIALVKFLDYLDLELRTVEH